MLMLARSSDDSCAVGQEEGQLRLVSRVDINGFATGALQVVVNGEYGAVCSQSFGGAEADVACRQLGFLGGSALPLLGQPSRGTGPRYLSDEFRESILQVGNRCTRDAV